MPHVWNVPARGIGDMSNSEKVTSLLRLGDAWVVRGYPRQIRPEIGLSVGTPTLTKLSSSCTLPPRLRCVRHILVQVTYCATGFLEKNNDTLQEDLRGLLLSSRIPFLRQVGAPSISVLHIPSIAITSLRHVLWPPLVGPEPNGLCSLCWSP